MIPRNEYVGPLTKSAEAMFARAERSARRAARTANAKTLHSPRPPSPIRQAVNALGLSMAILRHWEDAGVIGFERRQGRRIVDDAALDCLRNVAALRRAGFAIKEIAWISDILPPPAAALRDALQAHLAQREAARARTIALVRLSSPVAA